jgi:DNA-binding CsgD family transcriptional regulator
VVRLVEEYVDAHAAEPVGVPDLVALTGASARSIDAAFQSYRGTTPAAFLRTRRLERARQMLRSDPARPAASVAHAAGFLRAEPFEAAYFKAFQESPAETRQRGGGPAGGASPGAETGGRDADAMAGSLALLSRREREVCAAVARGLLNKQIAAELGISERTVREHRGAAMKKLGVRSAAELGRLFERVGR